jgi:hypothetical protein
MGTSSSLSEFETASTVLASPRLGISAISRPRLGISATSSPPGGGGIMDLSSSELSEQAST